MKNYFCIMALLVLIACGQSNTNIEKNPLVSNDSLLTYEKEKPEDISKLTEKTIKFLWRADKYDEGLKSTFNSIFIDEDYSNSIIDSERAALGYVATFIGNECWWDGEANGDRSNLKCKILTALNLGYQCSDEHLGFLRLWFKDDIESLKKLENCPTTPYTSTIQETFDEITLSVKESEILIFCKVSGVNLRAGNSWSWTKTDHFLVEKDKIKLIKRVKSEIIQEKLEISE